MAAPSKAPEPFRERLRLPSRGLGTRSPGPLHLWRLGACRARSGALRSVNYSPRRGFVSADDAPALGEGEAAGPSPATRGAVPSGSALSFWQPGGTVHGGAK